MAVKLVTLSDSKFEGSHMPMYCSCCVFLSASFITETKGDRLQGVGNKLFHVHCIGHILMKYFCYYIVIDQLYS